MSAAKARPALRRAVELYLAFALGLALAPAVLLAAGFVAVEAGLSDWRAGFGGLMLAWASPAALAGVASGAVALMAALLAGFRRYWRRAFLVLAITTVTLAAHLWSVWPDPGERAAGFGALAA